MDLQPEIVAKVLGWLDQAFLVAKGWLLSPAAWSQLGLLVAAFVLAVYAARRLQPLFHNVISPAKGSAGMIAQTRVFVLRFLPLPIPLLACFLTAVGEDVTRSIFGSGAVIAFGKRVFLFLAARIFVREVVTDGFLRLLGKYVLIPVAALYALGVLDQISLRLEETVVALGNIKFSVMSLIRGEIVCVATRRRRRTVNCVGLARVPLILLWNIQ